MRMSVILLGTPVARDFQKFKSTVARVANCHNLYLPSGDLAHLQEMSVALLGRLWPVTSIIVKLVCSQSYSSISQFIDTRDDFIQGTSITLLGTPVTSKNSKLIVARVPHSQFIPTFRRKKGLNMQSQSKIFRLTISEIH